MPHQPLYISFLLAKFSAGGAQSVMVNLANSMTQKGVQVDFVVADCEGPFFKQVSPAVNIIDLKTKKMTRSLFRLVTYLKNNRPDVLLATQKHTNIVACLIKFFPKISTRIILRPSSTPSISYQNGTIKDKIIYQIARICYPFADYYIGQSEGQSADFCSFYRVSKQKIKTIPNPIISKKMIELAEEKCEHAWLEEDSPILISIGRSCVAKDFKTLIKAFAIVRKEKACRLFILGDMESEGTAIYKELKELIKANHLEEDICFPGFVKNPFPYLRQADIYILSSIYEGLPGALIQAMALGCNVVATDCPNGPKEIIERGTSGILVPIRDYAALAKGMLYHLNYPTRPSYELSIFEEEYATQRYLAVIKNLLVKEEVKNLSTEIIN